MNTPPANDRTLPLAISLAALFHDVGKATKWFQGKLRGTTNTQNDFLRHELLSAIFVEELVKDAKTDAEWLSRLAPTTCQTTIKHAYHAMIEQIQTIIKKLAAEKSEDAVQKCVGMFPHTFISTELPIARAIHWMVLSHHKMPRGRKTISDGYTWRNFSARDLEPQDKKQMTAPSSKLTGLPDEKEWITAVSDCAKLLQQHLTSSSLLGTVSYGRLALMISDKWESNSPTRPLSQIEVETRILAKSIDKKGSPPVALSDHLIDEARRTSIVYNALLAGGGPTIAPSELPITLTDRRKGYEWQDAAVDLAADHNPEHGLFVVNGAETGAGKTIGNAKIMAAASPTGLRYTFTQGLRSLVFQTAIAHKEDLEFKDGQHIGVRIGSAVVTRMAESVGQTSKNDDDKPIDAGSESDENDDAAEQDDTTVRLADGADQTLEGILAIGASISKKNNRNYLSVPILVCTLDSLMGVANNTVNRHAHHFLRLMTSDVIIDEIDDFSEEDQCAIGRLMRAIGTYGRKVIIASATLPPATVEAMFSAYINGYREHCEFKGIKPVVDALFVSHVVESVRIRSYDLSDALSEPTNQFRDAWTDFSKTVVRYIEAAIKRRKVEILDTRGCGKTGIFKVVLDGCKELHDRHHIPVSGIRVSVGAVRWANTPQTFEFARFLLNQKNWGIRPICYHSKLMGVTRFDIEQRLDLMLKPIKPAKGVTRLTRDEQLVSHPDVQRAIDKVRAEGGTDLMIILSTSPIIEVGRDYDLDWGICDPSGLRSLIQFAGRIGRHRRLSPDAPNIKIMELPHRAIRQNNDDPVFRRPGVETDSPSVEKKFRLREKLSSKVFDIGVISDALDARDRLLEAGGGRIGIMEHAKLRLFLQGGKENTCSLTAFLQEYPVSGMTDRYVERMKFRRQTMLDCTIVSENDTRMYRYEMTKYGPKRVDDKTYEITKEPNSDYMLFSFDQPENRFKELLQTVFLNSPIKEILIRYEMMGCSFKKYRGDPKLAYNLSLGLDESGV